MTKTITAIRVQQRRHDRASVYLDDAYAFGLQLVLAARLHVGDELTPAEIADLKRQDEAERAYEATLRFLSYRPRSRREVEQYLAKRQAPDDQAAEIIARLERSRLVDDEAFARFWVDNRVAFRPRSRWALGHELYAKGVERDAIEAATAEVDEAAGALQVALKGSRRYAQLDRGTFTRRLLALLQRRGYRYGVAAPAVQEAWRQLEEASADTED
jgi:regulatory protein